MAERRCGPILYRHQDLVEGQRHSICMVLEIVWVEEGTCCRRDRVDWRSLAGGGIGSGATALDGERGEGVTWLLYWLGEEQIASTPQR